MTLFYGIACVVFFGKRNRLVKAITKAKGNGGEKKIFNKKPI
jgi:hypothetical protein